MMSISISAGIEAFLTMWHSTQCSSAYALVAGHGSDENNWYAPVASMPMKSPNNGSLQS